MKRQNFTDKVKQTLYKQAAYICSNHDCKCSTVASSATKMDEVVFTGEAAHISAASEGGARYDSNMNSKARHSIENAIFLCVSCHTMIDKNGGMDYPIELLRQWKDKHHLWVRSNINKKVKSVTRNEQEAILTTAILIVKKVFQAQHHTKNIVTRVKYEFKCEVLNELDNSLSNLQLLLENSVEKLEIIDTLSHVYNELKSVLITG